MDRFTDAEPRLLTRYALHGEIASGGMATVHFGRLRGAHGFARTVAIKRLHPQFARSAEFRNMLLDEANLAARIRHPNVVATLELVQEEDELFLVMEYVAGDSLSRLLRECHAAGERIPPPIGCALLLGTLEGLHAAHEATTESGTPLQIVHRDVSPQNILVGRDGMARVLDFGIARATVRCQASREGQLKGKLRYMAPEQLRGAPVDRRADVYAAAVVLWEVLAGRQLFEGESEAEIFGRILEGIIRPPSAFADLPPGLDDLVLRGLAARPEDRYATAFEMARALEGALEPASLHKVSAWVEHTIGEHLALLDCRLATIEASASLADPASARASRPQWPEAPATSDRAKGPVSVASVSARGSRPQWSEASTQTDITQAPTSAAPRSAQASRPQWSEASTKTDITRAPPSVTQRSALPSRPQWSESPTMTDMARTPVPMHEAPMSAPEAPHRSRVRWLGIVAVLGLAGAAIGVLSWGPRATNANGSAAVNPPASPSGEPAPAAPASAPEAPIGHDAPAEPPAPAPSLAAAPSPAATVRTPPPVTSPRARPPTQPAPRTPSTQPAPRSPSPCDPPYFVGKDGIRRVKRGCL
ncbi:serine/threonine-protein kinase [Polyangium aurulentum]|uniref:serine/threonine-protein kinase n=1 Tax=Polyangium aurulentum TaxID=2567896 RepID=UPI0010AEA88D|nr:serine/threonine-protein kinase [Polyangium aurulentum]UQA59867.1 protein kinase [Polyangium aurulentum]